METIFKKLQQLAGRINSREPGSFYNIYATYVLNVGDQGPWTLEFQDQVSVREGKDPAAECFLSLSPQDFDLLLESRRGSWDEIGARLQTNNRFRAAQLLEAVWPGTLQQVMPPHLAKELFPAKTAVFVSSGSLESYFEEHLRGMLRENPRLFGLINAVFEIEIKGLGTWSLDARGSGEIKKGSLEGPRTKISLSLEDLDLILKDPSQCWPLFNQGRIRTTNACRASQFVRGAFPEALRQAMPPSLYHELYPEAHQSPTYPECCRKPSIHTGFILTRQGPREIKYAEQDGFAIWQGDIILGTLEQMEGVRLGVKKGFTAHHEFTSFGLRIFNPDDPAKYVWPGGVVIINSTLQNKTISSDAKAAIQAWTSQTRISFKFRTNEPNYVTLREGEGCTSNVGMNPGENFITLSKGCGVGGIIHEIGHTIGLRHEQSRLDRDQFVRILWDNIIESEKGNFMIESLSQDIGNYDYGSIMHYGAFDFSSNGKKTIQTIPNEVPIGNRSNLSAGDLAAVAEIYGWKT